MKEKGRRENVRNVVLVPASPAAASSSVAKRIGFRFGFSSCCGS
jgi:hypothetical protein